uniref:Uncharacterized protein n=1 Tax=Cacopsylla melanoneura TaxID=428564 RepID=A0A8D8WD45_9HEMI
MISGEFSDSPELSSSLTSQKFTQFALPFTSKSTFSLPIFATFLIFPSSIVASSLNFVTSSVNTAPLVLPAPAKTSSSFKQPDSQYSSSISFDDELAEEQLRTGFWWIRFTE